MSATFSEEAGMRSKAANVLAVWFALHVPFTPTAGSWLTPPVLGLLAAGIFLRSRGIRISPRIVVPAALAAGLIAVFSGADPFAAFSAGSLSLAAVVLLGSLSARAAALCMGAALVFLAALALDRRVSGIVIAVDVAVLLYVQQTLHAPVPLRLGRMLLRTLALAVPVALAVSAAFFVFPALSQRANVALAGFAGELNPLGISGIRPSRRLAQVATFAGGVPPVSKWYWRGKTLDGNGGFAWRSSLPQPVGSGGEMIRYSLKALGTTEAVPLDLPADDAPENPVAGEEIPRASTLGSPRDLPEPLFRFLQVPESVKKDERVARIASGLPGKKKDARSVIEALETFFREGGFIYSARPGPVRSMGDFLAVGRRGYCEHYAAASANLLRLAGVPTRVVTGYCGGAWNPWLGTITVRDADAHAWVEAWDAASGSWIRFDPTRVVAPDFHERIETLNDPGRWPWYRFFGAFSEAAIARVAESASAGIQAAGPLLLALFFSVTLFVSLRLRRARFDSPALAALAKVEKRAAARNLARFPGETPLAWLARAGTSGKCEPPSAKAFARYYEKNRYSASPSGEKPPEVVWKKS